MPYDLIIVGGGPAGLCAAINGASEGLSTLLIEEGSTFGGQARESAAIENYPLPIGSEQGVTGEQLMQGFASQAAKFGVHLLGQSPAVRLEAKEHTRIVTTSDFQQFESKAIILSVGLKWRKLEAEGIGRMPIGVYYGVPSFSKFSNKNTVVVVGGANSAGQAVVRLAAMGCKVKLISRSALEKQMSTYLITRIRALPNVEVCEECQIKEVHTRDGKACSVTTAGPLGNEKYDIQYLFIMIGAVPHTAWLLGSVALDQKRFILTDYDLPAVEGTHKLSCETSMPGVFAAGDVRAGQFVKRITSAVGDGISALQSVHRYCEEWRKQNGN